MEFLSVGKKSEAKALPLVIKPALTAFGMADVDDAVSAAAEAARQIAERLVQAHDPVQQYPVGSGAEPQYQGGDGSHDDGNDLLGAGNNKRKYEDDEEGGGEEQHPVRKKSSFSNGPDPSLNGVRVSLRGGRNVVTTNGVTRTSVRELSLRESCAGDGDLGLTTGITRLLVLAQ